MLTSRQLLLEALVTTLNQGKKEKFCRGRSKTNQVPVVYTYNPSYSGGRDLEDLGLKPAWANSS
jgi:hypothetical protein